MFRELCTITVPHRLLLDSDLIGFMCRRNNSNSKFINFTPKPSAVPNYLSVFESLFFFKCAQHLSLSLSLSLFFCLEVQKSDFCTCLSAIVLTYRDAICHAGYVLPSAVIIAETRPVTVISKRGSVCTQTREPESNAHRGFTRSAAD